VVLAVFENKSLNFFLIFNFEISLPSIPQLENKSLNFFLFLILKSHYPQYHSLKIKVEIFYFGF